MNDYRLSRLKGPDRIFEALRRKGQDGRLSRTEIRDLFGRNATVGEIQGYLDQLLSSGLASPIKILTIGRPAEAWSLDGIRTELACLERKLRPSRLTILERAEALSRRKDIYEALHPEARHGGAPGKAGGGKKTTGVSSFAEDASRKTRVSVRTIQRQVLIAENITAQVRDTLRATTFANSQADLLEIARLKPDQQIEVAKALVDGRAATVRSASLLLNGANDEDHLPGGQERRTLEKLDTTSLEDRWINEWADR